MLLKKKSFSIFNLLLIVCIFLAACTPVATQTQAPASTQAAAPSPMPTADRSNPKELILATTTSTRDSGLLDELLPIFENQTGLTVKVIAVGSGQAMQMGKEGNADVLLVHSPKAEKEYMDGGFGKERLLVMHNDFVIVGPAEDPAKIKGMPKAADAFKAIAAAKAIFTSRGDKSGTNSAELALWKKAELSPSQSDSWYLQTGQGMGDTLNITSEKAGYTLTDRATYLAMKDKLSLDILVEGDTSLLNVYHVITVNPDKFPLVNKDNAKSFADFMVNSDTQKLIGEFGKEKFGAPLFTPDAGKSEEEVGLG
jgi:tungstate transport system substrate-binding protein